MVNEPANDSLAENTATGSLIRVRQMVRFCLFISNFIEIHFVKTQLETNSANTEEQGMEKTRTAKE